MRIAIINGPNLNLIGQREQEIYGSQSLTAFIEQLQLNYPEQEIIAYQSNVEGELINAIQQAAKESEALIINAGGYSHTSVAIADALRFAHPKPIIEVHISNIFSREEYRHHSFVSAVSTAVICGCGLQGYALAIEFLLKKV
jgi:3-dehydroquinate dehydratase-2